MCIRDSLVTAFALQGHTLEHNLAGAERKRGPAVTLLAGGAAVRSGESETGPGMIEARHLAPRPHVMADFAGVRPTPGSEIRGQTGPPAEFRQKAPEIHGRLVSPQKAIVRPTYLRLMRIQMAAGATEIGELIGRGVVELRLVPVAIAAGDGDVPAFQREARLVVARQRELCWLEAVHRVAGFATVLIWRVRKLAGVWVTVAVYALLVPHLVAVSYTHLTLPTILRV